MSSVSRRPPPPPPPPLLRSNDRGDLVVTKGDQYDVREAGSEEGKGDVRNLGKPVDLSGRYGT